MAENTHYLTVLEASSPESAALSRSQGVGRIALLLEVLGENLYTCLFQLLGPGSLHPLTRSLSLHFQGQQGKHLAAGVPSPVVCGLSPSDPSY